MLISNIQKVVQLVFFCTSALLMGSRLPDEVEFRIQNILQSSSHEWTFDNTIGLFANLILDLREQYPRDANFFFQEITERELLMEVLSYSAARFTQDPQLDKMERYLTKMILEFSTHNFIRRILKLNEIEDRFIISNDDPYECEKNKIKRRFIDRKRVLSNS